MNKSVNSCSSVCGFAALKEKLWTEFNLKM